MTLFGRVFNEGGASEQPEEYMTLEAIQQRGGFEPCIVKQYKQMLMPPPNLTINDIVAKVGPERLIPVIDVRQQQELADTMRLDEFAALFQRKVAELAKQSDEDVDVGEEEEEEDDEKDEGEEEDATKGTKKTKNPILNVLSMEVSNTDFSNTIRLPRIVRQLDWTTQAWPMSLVKQGAFPKVRLYCLMSMAGNVLIVMFLFNILFSRFLHRFPH